MSLLGPLTQSLLYQSSEGGRYYRISTLVMENEPEREIKYFAQGYVASGASLVAQMVKNLLAMQETWV